MSEYAIEVIAAASRVGRTFASGADRCDMDDLMLLKDHKLMATRRCTKACSEMQDSIEPGETMFEFNREGRALVAVILGQEKDAA